MEFLIAKDAHGDELVGVRHLILPGEVNHGEQAGVFISDVNGELAFELIFEFNVHNKLSLTVRPMPMEGHPLDDDKKPVEPDPIPLPLNTPAIVSVS